MPGAHVSLYFSNIYSYRVNFHLATYIAVDHEYQIVQVSINIIFSYNTWFIPHDRLISYNQVVFG